MMVLRLALLCLILSTGAGCSVQFGYNNLDRFARWGVSDYIALTAEQRRYFDEEFGRLHRWHRRTQLPIYADFLEAMPETFADGATAEELWAMEQTVRRWVEVAMEEGLPMAATLLCMLSDEQVADLPRRLEASNKEISDPERSGDLERAQAFWAEEISDAFRRFAGRMTGAQIAYLKARSVEYIPERQMWAEYRRRWQADLLKLLMVRHDIEKFDQAFFDMARNRERYFGTELTAIFAHNEALNREVGAWLIEHLTDDQRRRAAERVQELADDFRALYARSEEACC